MAHRKKVIHVINSLNILGGAEKIATDICKEYNQIILFKKSNINSIYDCDEISKMSYNSTVHLLWILIRNHNSFFYFHLFPGNWLSIFLRPNNFIIHEHNVWNRRRNYKVLRFIEYLIYRRAFKIVCISDAVKVSLTKWLKFKIKNIVTVDNYIIKPSEKDRCWFASNSFILFAASFTDQKGHIKFLKEWNNSKYKNSFKVILAGDGHLKDSIQSLILKLNMQKNVILVGNVNLGIYLKKCFCVILPSKWEGFGLIAIEAAYYKKFTIGTNVPGLNKLIEPSCLLKQNYTYQSIDLILSDLILNKVDFNFLVKILKKYDRTIFMNKIDKLFKEIIKK